MAEIAKNNTLLIDEILADFFVFFDPKILKKEYINLIDVGSLNRAGLEKYQQLLINVKDIFKKTLRYAKYFENFYPPEAVGIEKYEALSYHIHAYLEDASILKNKIEVMLGVMKNDLIKVASNDKEIKEFFKAGIQKNNEVFKGILSHRDPHHHRGMMFRDGTLLKAENAHKEIEMLSRPPFSEMLNQKYKPELMEKLEKEKKESFEAAKNHWVDIAQKNDEQMTGYLGGLLEAVKPPLYQFLGIDSVKDIIASANK
jgi:hypothetical protein